MMRQLYLEKIDKHAEAVKNGRKGGLANAGRDVIQ